MIQSYTTEELRSQFINEAKSLSEIGEEIDENSKDRLVALCDFLGAKHKLAKKFDIKILKLFDIRDVESKAEESLDRYLRTIVNFNLYTTNVSSKLLKSDCKCSSHKDLKNNIRRLVLEKFVLF